MTSPSINVQLQHVLGGLKRFDLVNLAYCNVMVQQEIAGPPAYPNASRPQKAHHKQERILGPAVSPGSERIEAACTEYCAAMSSCKTQVQMPHVRTHTHTTKSGCPEEVASVNKVAYKYR